MNVYYPNNSYQKICSHDLELVVPFVTLCGFVDTSVLEEHIVTIFSPDDGSSMFQKQ